jgi:phosphoglycerol transferase MdoB-like AlkP superfamily enzyme
MSRQLIFYLRFLLFWLTFFLFQRIVFLLLNLDQLHHCTLSLFANTFLYGELMDVSISSYILALIILIFFMTLPFSRQTFFGIMKPAVYILIILTCLVTVCDAALYHSWGTRINEKAISVLLFPHSVLDAVRSADYILLSVTAALNAFFFIYFFPRVVPGKVCLKDHTKKKFAILYTLLLLPLLVIGARGGLQKYPIGKSTVFFSDNFTCNYAALNPLWNFMDVLINIPGNSGCSSQYYSETFLQTELGKLFQSKEKGDFPHLFTVSRPNFVMILLESFSAENLTKLKGLPVANKLNMRLDSSLWFENCYANGYRSEHALIALMSGTAPPPGKSLMRESGKVIRLPIFSKLIKDSLGYSLQFYNTYDINYARVNEYLSCAGFDKIISDKNFEGCRHHPWGAYDECLFDLVLGDLKNNRPPFFSIVFTSVSHEPFEADVPKFFSGKTEKEKYMNTICYTDSCLESFLTRARIQPWYKNTIFIILADHGHSLPLNRNNYDPLHYKIPLLIFGEPLRKELAGRSVPYPVSQLDLPATLLHQLGMKSDIFPLSRDLMKEEQEHFAFFIFSDGIGFISQKHLQSYNSEINRIIYSSDDSLSGSADVTRSKILLQYLFKQYRSYN